MLSFTGVDRHGNRSGESLYYKTLVYNTTTARVAQDYITEGV
jgi:hypothetical protein